MSSELQSSELESSVSFSKSSKLLKSSGTVTYSFSSSVTSQTAHSRILYSTENVIHFSCRCRQSLKCSENNHFAQGKDMSLTISSGASGTVVKGGCK